jgi:hypothetical protein
VRNGSSGWANCGIGGFPEPVDDPRGGSQIVLMACSSWDEIGDIVSCVQIIGLAAKWARRDQIALGVQLRPSYPLVINTKVGIAAKHLGSGKVLGVYAGGQKCRS